jgi:hypothetical protein
MRDKRVIALVAIGVLIIAALAALRPAPSSSPGRAVVAPTPSQATQMPAAAQPAPVQPAAVTVYVTATGECYHRAGCRYLTNSASPISLQQAKAGGYRPCQVCNPPQ